ncbi:MAG: guanylate kinase [Muribaculaceae bacterium]|nr:guanylate kinase [Muribaculaceae bacterium]
MEGKGKVIVFSAPSGCGKSTIIQKLRERGNIDFAFSVSATNRAPREGEKDGVNYYFMTDDEFKTHIDKGDFIEYCEVYPGKFYGTLKSEVIRRCNEGHNVILDIDVEGGENVMKLLGNDVLTLFIMPPSIDELRSRLQNRGTDSPDKIEERLSRANYEISFAPKYDVVITNDVLQHSVEECEKVIEDFIESTV